MSSHRDRYAPKPDLRTLLAQRGLTVAAAERASGLARGSLSRILTGKRGRWLRHETVRRLSRGTKIPLGVLATALERTRMENEERTRGVRAARLARLEAELGW